MAPLSISLVGYPVSHEAMERYRTLYNLPDSSRLFVQDLQSKINVPLALIGVEEEDAGSVSDYYLCCFADCSERPYEPEDLLAIPVPPAFHQLPQLIPVEGDLQRLFAPRAFSYSRWVSPK
jgi:hypothetical protein